MREIDITTWARREHFQTFGAFHQPHFALCAPMDITAFHRYVQDHGLSFTVAVVFLLARAANAIPEFRQRIRGGTVVEHDVVHPSTTIMTAGELFSFCTIPYEEDFGHFAPRALERITETKVSPTLEDEPGQDDLLFLSAIPWVSFTSFRHPTPASPIDSVPRLVWGKHFEDGDRVMMPVSVQGHHALMDGVHMGKFYAELERLLARPQSVLGQIAHRPHQGNP